MVEIYSTGDLEDGGALRAGDVEDGRWSSTGREIKSTAELN